MRARLSVFWEAQESVFSKVVVGRKRYLKVQLKNVLCKTLMYGIKNYFLHPQIVRGWMPARYFNET